MPGETQWLEVHPKGAPSRPPGKMVRNALKIALQYIWLLWTTLVSNPRIVRWWLQTSTQPVPLHSGDFDGVGNQFRRSPRVVADGQEVVFERQDGEVVKWESTSSKFQKKGITDTGGVNVCNEASFSLTMSSNLRWNPHKVYKMGLRRSTAEANLHPHTPGIVNRFVAPRCLIFPGPPHSNYSDVSTSSSFQEAKSSKKQLEILIHVTPGLLKALNERYLTVKDSYSEPMSGQTLDIENWMVTVYDVDRQEQMGSGGFGDVYRAIWHKTEVAMKIVRTDRSA
ncbi:hypothetical protein B0H19DRAFT_1065495 [Mycena capillaripes]|nr:hypothetical protein B0H19DRAFT_1065495 [Mycena capillaripes]